MSKTDFIDPMTWYKPSGAIKAPITKSAIEVLIKYIKVQRLRRNCKLHVFDGIKRIIA